MSETQSCQRYTGITRHAGKWLVKLRYQGKDVTIGHFEHAEDAAWAADYARYMCFGLNPAYWHHNVAKPNFPPKYCPPIPGVTILRRLVSAEIVPAEVLERHLDEYHAALDQNAAPLKASSFA